MLEKNEGGGSIDYANKMEKMGDWWVLRNRVDVEARAVEEERENKRGGSGFVIGVSGRGLSRIYFFLFFID